MIAKDKAKELVNRFLQIYDGRVPHAKRCALICVDEIIDIPSIQTAYAQGYNKSKSTESYWQEVKQEINKL